VIKVFIADSHALVRAGLSVLLSAHKTTVEVTGVVAQLDEFQQYAPSPPHVVFLGRLLPPFGIVETIARVRTLWPTSKIAIVSDSTDPAIRKSLYFAGCDGFLTWEMCPAELTQALEQFRQGLNYLPELNPSSPRTGTARNRRNRSDVPALSARERQVLILLSRGHSYKQIAEKLELGVKSIETYRARLFKKLELNDKTDLIRFAMEQGMMRPGIEI
jgi:DNA-binding NarL/FixJ family response regulator